MSEEVKAARKGRAAAPANAKSPRSAKSNRATRETQIKTDATVGELIFMVSRVAAEFEATLKASDPVLSLSQWALLEMLSREDGSARPSQLARKLGFSRQLVRQATQKLLSLKLVEKEESGEGKKAVGLMLSDQGRKTLADIGTTTDAMSESLKAGSGGGSTKQAVRVLKGLSAAMPANAESRGQRRKKKTAETAGAEAPEEAVEA